MRTQHQLYDQLKHLLHLHAVSLNSIKHDKFHQGIQIVYLNLSILIHTENSYEMNQLKLKQDLKYMMLANPNMNHKLLIQHNKLYFYIAF
jgi:hypothetical protein